MRSAVHEVSFLHRFGRVEAGRPITPWGFGSNACVPLWLVVAASCGVDVSRTPELASDAARRLDFVRQRAFEAYVSDMASIESFLEGDGAPEEVADSGLVAVSRCTAETEVVHAALGEVEAVSQFRWSLASSVFRQPPAFAPATPADFEAMRESCSHGLMQATAPSELAPAPSLAARLRGSPEMRSSPCETEHCVLPTDATWFLQADVGAEVQGLLHAVVDTCVQRGDAPEGAASDRFCACMAAPIVLDAIAGEVEAVEYVRHATWALRHPPARVTSELGTMEGVPSDVVNARAVCVERST